MAEDLTQIGAYHLAQNPEIYEVQRSNNFEFIVNMGDLLKVYADESDGESAYITGDKAQEIIRFSVVSASLPMFSQQPIEIRRGNSVMKAAGIPTFTDGSLVVNDYIGADTKSVLMSWQQLSYNVKTQKVGNMADYKKTCYLQEYTPDYKLVRTWKLLGCWVSSIQEGEFNMEDGSKKTISANITYDYAIMEKDIDE